VEQSSKKGSVNTPNQRLAILDFRSDGFVVRVLFAIAAILLASPFLAAQTVATGNIAGIVTDPKGKPIADAKIEISNIAKPLPIHVATSSVGWYSSGPMQPGRYSVRIEAKGFKTVHLTVPVHGGNTQTANVTLQAGPKVLIVEIPETTPVNVQQAGVQAVFDESQMEKLPINGRNISDFAQLEPSVQIQDGGVLDPPKNGVNAISLLSHYGSGTRISVDGVEISDEIVGAPTQNVSAGAVQEFQVSQTFLNLSTGPTSSGAVNLITRSGGNSLHGALFGVFRGDKGAAAQPPTAPQGFSRELFGGHVGGPVIKNKVFWFADAERAKQDLIQPEPFAFPFNSLGGDLAEPYRGFDTDERVDWNMRGSARAFYRFNFFQNTDLRPFGAASSTQRLSTDNNTFTNALGVDFQTGAYAHSFRIEYLKLRSSVTDATSTLSGFDNLIPGLGINIGAYMQGNCALSEGGAYCGGPSWFGFQREVQSNKQARYDGSRLVRDHVIHYGISFIRIDGARLADFGAFPQVGTSSAGTFASSNPTTYPANFVTLGNGLDFSTPQSGFGLPAGGLNPDNRLQFYFGDSFKAKPNLLLNYGVQYLHDSALTDTSLGPLPILNLWGAGYGDRIRNPNLNLSPQVGFAWNVGGGGKTVIRGGADLFFADPLLNNVLYDTPARLAQGNFLSTPEICSGGIAAPFPWPTSLAGIGSVAGGAATVVNTQTGPEALPTFCGGAISSVAPAILALSSAYQVAAASATSAPNSNYVGSTFTALNNRGYDLLYPGYRTPRSYQMNLGFEKAVSEYTTVSIYYVRNLGEHFLIGQDINHSGAARSFNEANALAARDAAQTAHGCPAGFGEATCMVAALGVAGAQAAYSAAGLDSNLQTAGGAPCSYCAFPGTNQISLNTGAVGGVDMLFPSGRSVYSGFQVKVNQRVAKLVRGVKNANFDVVYAYSKFSTQVQDQDGINLAIDNDSPTRFTGPDALDRKQQISFAGTFDLPLHTRFSLIGHFYSPTPQNISLPELTNGGEIFATDWLGAGLPANGRPEPLPGTQLDQFQRGTYFYNLREVITNYNHTYAGALTPAGACLVGDTAPNNPFSCPGLISGPPVMTPADMTALNWVMPTIDSVANQTVGIPWLKSMDVKLYWPFNIKDRVTIEPSASVFNVFNFWNAFLPGNSMNGALLPGVNGILAPTVVGGVTPGSSLAPFRANYQSGTYALGTPRTFEFGLHVSF
jgi:Carboxypeptidase regulatory-like domain